MVNKAVSYVAGQSRVTVYTDETKLSFLKSDTHLPKVILFNDKPNVPIYLQALSKTFKGKLIFGLFDKN